MAILLWAAAAAPPGQLAYVSADASGAYAVHVRDLASGTAVSVPAPSSPNPPVWAPDGAHVVFEAVQPAGTSIALAAADGSGLRLLKHVNPWNTQPRWSPDGRLLAYVSGRGAEQRIAVYDLSTDTETLWGGTATGLMRPVWFVDNTLLAVGLRKEGETLSSDIVQVSRDQILPLAPPSKGKYFEWSIEPDPRGKFIAYESNDGGDREVYVASFRKGVNNVSNHRAADWNPVWSHDGKWIAFESFRNGRRGVFRTFPETSRVYKVAAEPASDNWAPAWSPDGKWIAFVSDRSGRPAVYACRIEGGDTQLVTPADVNAWAPAWRPERKSK